MSETSNSVSTWPRKTKVVTTEEHFEWKDGKWVPVHKTVTTEERDVNPTVGPAIFPQPYRRPFYEEGPSYPPFAPLPYQVGDPPPGQGPTIWC